MSHRTPYRAISHFALGAMATALMIPAAQAQPKAAMPAINGNMAASSGMPSKDMNMKSMMKDMDGKMPSMPMSGNADVDFAMMMRVHHQGAIDMANAELSSGKDPQMKKMAKAIIAAQKKEIAQFDGFLAKHGHAASRASK